MYCSVPRVCPNLDTMTPPVAFEYNCTNGNRFGSVCTLSCSKPEHILLHGRPEMRCYHSRRWNQVVERIHCGKYI